MTPFFITCTLDSFIYRRNERVVNHPINLNNCTKLIKSKFAWYPDNEGKPAITFVGCDTQWAYHSTTERDAQFNAISQNKF